MAEETSSFEHIPPRIRNGYEIHEWRHASAVLRTDFPKEWKDLLCVLSRFTLRKSNILKPGGSKSPIALAIDGLFTERG